MELERILSARVCRDHSFEASSNSMQFMQGGNVVLQFKEGLYTLEVLYYAFYLHYLVLTSKQTCYIHFLARKWSNDIETYLIFIANTQQSQV